MGIINTLQKIGLNQNILYHIGTDTVGDITSLNNVLSQEVEFTDNPLFHHEVISKLFSSRLPDPPIWNGEKPSKKVLLTAEQEETAFLRYNFFMFIVFTRKVFLFDNVENMHKAKRIDTVKEIWSWYCHARYVKEFIVSCNLRLVMNLAHKFNCSYGIDIHELVSAGSFALMKSVEKFDVVTGNKFSTYAFYAITRSFSRLGLERSKKKRISFQMIRDDDNGRYIGIEPVVKENENADSIVMIQEIMEENMANLTEIEGAIIRLRYLHSDKKPSAVKVSEQLGIAPNLVYRHEKNGFRKIRRVIRNKFS